MTLENWLANKWVKKDASSPAEINALLAKVGRDIADAGFKDITADWRLAMAYNACLGCATVALRCHGYRIAHDAGHHHRTIESLRFTLQPDSELLIVLQAVRKKRNAVTYDSAGSVSETEVKEVLNLARQLRDLTTRWLRSNFPHMLG